MSIKRVWIEEGCIACGACSAECPDVFNVTDDACMIRDAVREDGQESENRIEKSPIKADLASKYAAAIKSAASSCPVEVIEYE